MTILRSKTFAKDFKRLPQNIQQKAERQLRMLVTDWRHPSLSSKKMKGHPDIWEARVDYHHRITFQITQDTLVLRTVGAHDTLKQP